MLAIELSGGEISLTASPEGWFFKGKVTFEDAVCAKQTIDAEGNIGTRAELSDSKGTMAGVREIFNNHDHDETDSVTLPPNQPM
ncbi:hypothetical protein D8682_06750 [Buttiauxella sp. 3AFRM03]|uniref:hypothetical protein n=1 Tax=Buttiauxella sp. 3AFRM03 TaxID=2479367 RepID=UPI000EF7FD7A|nr:hypothetical protein [Buttiauxella sp. 3AFRM03]AYN26713.1 hypothetical protein D8682_06750 [Buttiauxella sp. 3AFRM03]